METPELTTRDVLAQIDRRLSRLEDDVREFRQYVDERFSRLENEVRDLRRDFNAKIDAHFRWQVGISLGLWASVMSAVLLR